MSIQRQWPPRKYPTHLLAHRPLIASHCYSTRIPAQPAPEISPRNRAPALNLTSQDPGNSRVLGPGKWSFLLQSPGDDTSTPASCRYCIRGALLAMCIGAAHRTRNSAQLSSKFARSLACSAVPSDSDASRRTGSNPNATCADSSKVCAGRTCTRADVLARSLSILDCRWPRQSPRCKQPGCPPQVMRTRTSSSSSRSTCTCLLRVESPVGPSRVPALALPVDPCAPCMQAPRCALLHLCIRYVYSASAIPYRFSTHRK